jgi:hypothetical protein
MSAPLGDLMGNALTEPIADVSESTDDIEISVLDDRPESDQVPARDESRAKPLALDEEIEEVGGSVNNRIKRLKYEYHEERRSKEAAERMREEAVRYADHIAKENADLKSILHRGEKVLLSEIKGRADGELDRARVDYKSAYESGDADKLVKAQEALNQSQYDLSRASEAQPTMPDPAMVPPTQPARAAPVDPKLQSWLQKNRWFGDDEELTSFAYGVHEKLVKKDGLDPRSDEYYTRIDQRLRDVFPGKFENGMGAEEPAASSRASSVVAPANRSSGKPRQVQLTSTQVALAKRLGITPQQYAHQLLKETR